MLRLPFIITIFFILFSRPANAQEDSIPEIPHDLDAYLDSVQYTEEDYEFDEPVSFFPADTLPVQPRDFDESILKELREDKDFDYSEPPTIGESLWDRFWQWIGQIIGKIFEGAITTNWGRLFLYAGCVIVLVIIVMAVLKVDAFKVLFKGADIASGSGVFHENIHSMNFESLIQEAIGKQDFRNGVRLVFLYSLKLLSDGHHIHWEAGKTNHDYLEELKAAELKPGLGELSFYFDYAWYGGFHVSETQFARVQNIFNDWKGNIQ